MNATILLPVLSYIWVAPCSMRCFISHLFHSILCHACSHMLLPFSSMCIISSYEHIIAHPFSHWWTFGWLPIFGYYKQKLLWTYSHILLTHIWIIFSRVYYPSGITESKMLHIGLSRSKSWDGVLSTICFLGTKTNKCKAEEVQLCRGRGWTMTQIWHSLGKLDMELEQVVSISVFCIRACSFPLLPCSFTLGTAWPWAKQLSAPQWAGSLRLSTAGIPHTCEEWPFLKENMGGTSLFLYHNSIQMYSTLVNTAKLVYKMVVQFTLSRALYGSSHCFPSLPTIGTGNLLEQIGHSSGCVGVSHCDFILWLFLILTWGYVYWFEIDRERDREREMWETSIICLLYESQPGIEPATWVCALTGNLGIKPANFRCAEWHSNQLSHLARARCGFNLQFSDDY